MSNLAKRPDALTIEQVLVDGDLAGLTSEQRVTYITRVCDSLGINPLTKPLEYLRLNGKLVLYARKDCTDQLRRLHKVSLSITSRERIDDVFVVTARATMPDQRTDESIGAVPLGNLKGENLANALMKAETKAKRRATLSIVGLGILDESELDTVDAVPVAPGSEPRRAKALAPPAVLPPDDKAAIEACNALEALLRESTDFPTSAESTEALGRAVAEVTRAKQAGKITQAQREALAGIYREVTDVVHRRKGLGL